MVYRKSLTNFVKQRTTRAAGKYIVNELPKTYNDAVYPKLPFQTRKQAWKIKNRLDSSIGGRLVNYTYCMTDLFRDERIVIGYNRATEIRPYADRLIVEAMRYGDKHRPTMDLANFWLREKNLIHKLFKVFVPRYQNYSTAFTELHDLGIDYSLTGAPHKDVLAGKVKYSTRGQAILELRGNELPPIIKPKLDKAGLLTNILLSGARERKYGQSAFNPSSNQ